MQTKQHYILKMLMSMIITINAESGQKTLVMQEQIVEQKQNIADFLAKDDTSQQKSEYEQKIAEAIPKGIKDWIEEFHQDMISGKAFVTLPKLIEVPEGIQELDMAKAIAQEMGVPVVHIDKAYYTKVYGYEYFPIHRHPSVVELVKNGHKRIAIVADSVDTYEHQWRESRYVCDLLDQAGRSKFITILTARSANRVDPLIRGRIDRNFRMEPVIDVYDRHELVRSFLRDELCVGDVYEHLVPFIAEHTEGFSILDLDFLTTEIRATIKRAGLGARSMPLDRAEILINIRKAEIEQELNTKTHSFMKFCKQHKFMTSVVATVGLSTLIHYMHTYYKNQIKKK